MAQRVHVTLEDDIDGTTANETVQFAVDGATYEIDLSDGHATELREALSTWVLTARKVRGSNRSSSSSGASHLRTDPEQLTKVRQWGRVNGCQVSDRGRVSQQLQDAYRKAH